MMIIFCYDLIIILIMILIQGEYSSIFENILDLYRAHAEYDSGTEYKKKVWEPPALDKLPGESVWAMLGESQTAR